VKSEQFLHHLQIGLFSRFGKGSSVRDAQQISVSDGASLSKIQSGTQTTSKWSEVASWTKPLFLNPRVTRSPQFQGYFSRKFSKRIRKVFGFMSPLL
jgi:hypothetical protein